MIEYISFVLFMLLFIYLIFNNIKLRINHTDMIVKNLQLIIDNTTLASKLETALMDKEDDSVESSEGFLNFISQSRDWAFSYIEETQLAIGKFISEVEDDIEYFDKYGDLMSAEPNYNAMVKISKSFKELSKLVPDDYGKIET